MEKHARVACDCNGQKLAGTYEIDGDWLVLRSTLGVHRVRLGLAHPRKLAARLIKNLCTKAEGAAPILAPDAVGVVDKAQRLADVQRDRIVAMASDDPARPDEERVLDQMLVNARAIGSTSALLGPSGEERLPPPEPGLGQESNG